METAVSGGHHDVGAGGTPDGTCYFQCTGANASVNSGNWGDSTQETAGYETDKVWVGTNGAYTNDSTDDHLHTQAPHESGVGLELSKVGKKFARLAGISLLTSDYGTTPDATEDGYISTTTSGGAKTSKKVWRDPSFLQLINQQENYNTGF